MKAVLISIQPKWCELMASGKKTADVRKTKPKLEMPFKCYIYCTKPKKKLKYVFHETDYPEEMRPCKTVFCKVPDGSSPFCSEVNGNGKVIGEFTCNLITGLKANNGIQTYYNGTQGTCLTDAEIIKYASGKMIYYWHISDFVIYDKPKELGEFWVYNEELHRRHDVDDDRYCCYDATNEYGEALTDCGDAYNNILNCYHCWEEWSGWCHRLTRPPQSWCYVEENQI